MVASKRKREGEAPPLDDSQAWASHPRLKRHVECLLASSDPQGVFKRYEACAGQKRAQRLAVHVCAWVALLPGTLELLKPSVEVLTKLLQARCGKIKPWEPSSCFPTSQGSSGSGRQQLEDLEETDAKALRSHLRQRAGFNGSCQGPGCRTNCFISGFSIHPAVLAA